MAIAVPLRSLDFAGQSFTAWLPDDTTPPAAALFRERKFKSTGECARYLEQVWEIGLNGIIFGERLKRVRVESSGTVNESYSAVNFVSYFIIILLLGSAYRMLTKR